MATPIATADKSLPPRPKVVILPCTECPWKPGQKTISTYFSFSRISFPSTLLIVAFLNVESVTIPNSSLVIVATRYPNDANSLLHTKVDIVSPILVNRSISSSVNCFVLTIDNRVSVA